ncbi:type II and III secretion system protein [bacterium]|nr:type II and III secretion system protein [bacterium]
MKHFYRLTLTILIWGIFCLATDLFGQQIPVRNISQNELVTLDRSLPMKTALEILSQYSMKHEGKIIIDPKGHNGPINVLVNKMYWKRALEYVLRSNLLKFVEHEKYYEVAPLAAQQVGEEGIVINTGTREIEINAIFFEADYATLVEAGIDWSLLKNGQVRVNSSFGNQNNTRSFSAEYTDRFKTWNVSALLRAFESLNKGEVIANPQIKVMDGEEGKIKVGTNFFLTTEDFAGNTRFTEYEAGIILTVTPRVLGGDDSLFIHLDIKAERSDVFPDPVAVTKAITESNTQVLLLDGEETAMAGLFSNEVNETRRGIPILKDLPPWFFGLRYLFGFTSKEIQKKELIIILQARVLPTIHDRMTMRLGEKDLLEQRRLEFKRLLRRLKNKKGANGLGGR